MHRRITDKAFRHISAPVSLIAFFVGEEVSVPTQQFNYFSRIQIHVESLESRAYTTYTTYPHTLELLSQGDEDVLKALDTFKYIVTVSTGLAVKFYLPHK